MYLLTCLHCLGQASNLIGSASEEDLQVLFNGLDSIPASFPNDTHTDFPSVFFDGEPHAGAQNLDGPGLFTMHQLHTVVDNLYSHSSDQPAQPLDPVNRLQPPSTSRLPLIPPGQAPILHDFLV